MKQNEFFGGFFLLIEFFIVLMYWFHFDYNFAEGKNNDSNHGDTTPFSQYYGMFQDVHIMVFVGFGFLMAFLYRNSLCTTSHSMLVAAFSVLWAVLVNCYWSHAIGGAEKKLISLPSKKIPLSIVDFINGDFAAASVLISFGAVVGRCSASQLLVLALIEVLFYGLNASVAERFFGVADVGGSMSIHAFGAYFGLACSYILEKKADRQGKNTSLNASTSISDTTAMIGTLFLWCFWPSFVGIMAGQNIPTTVMNTYLAILASCVAAFSLCLLVHSGKFNMVIVQNSTLAGGVAIGASANMYLSPSDALLIGLIAGFLSVVGYKHITPWLEAHLGLKDTCGIHNLHGMPGVLGGLASYFALSERNDLGTFVGKNFAHRSIAAQAHMQIVTLCFTLILAISGGLVTGWVLMQFSTLEKFYCDSVEFEVNEECA